MGNEIVAVDDRPRSALTKGAERRFDVGLTITSFAAGCLVTLASLMWPHVVHVAPLASLCTIGLLGGLLTMRSASAALTRPVPDISLRDALNYLLNDAKVALAHNPAALRQPNAHEIAASVAFRAGNDAEGHRLLRESPEDFSEAVPHRGNMHTDAVEKVEAQLRDGNLTAFGYSALQSGDAPVSFEGVLSAIPTKYWQHAALNILFARIQLASQGQTCARPTVTYAEAQTVRRYRDIRLNRRQLHSLWAAKSRVNRAWARLTRQARVTDWLDEA